MHDPLIDVKDELMMYRLKLRYRQYEAVTLLVLMCFMFSCKKHAGIDHSLSIREYGNIGLPDPGKDWRSHDVSLAFAVLENLQLTNPQGLPLIDSKKSGEIFDRMFSRSHMSVLKDTSLPAEERLSMANSHLNNCENWFRIYSRNKELKGYYQDELAAILLYGLGISEQMVNLTHSMFGDNEEDDEYVNKVRSKYLAGVFAILGEQNQTSSYSEKNLQQICNNIVASVSRNLHWMSSITRADLKRALQDVSARQTSQSIISNYKSLMGKL